MEGAEPPQSQGDGGKGDGKGKGDAYLLRAIEHLLMNLESGNGDDDEAHAQSSSSGDVAVAAGGVPDDGETTERLLSALLLCTKLESGDERRRLLLNDAGPESESKSKSSTTGPALGWFALALIRQYVQVGSADDGDDKHEAGSNAEVSSASSEDVSFALLHLAVRSISLLYAEIPTAAASALTNPSSAREFHSPCMELLLRVLQHRSTNTNSNQELAIHEVDVETAATLTLMDQKGVVDMSASDRIRCTEIMTNRYRSSTGMVPSNDDDAAAATVDIDDDENADQDPNACDGTQQEQPDADAMMVQLIQSVLGESALVANNDETNKSGMQRQYAQIVAHFISALLESNSFVSEELLAGLLDLATPQKQTLSSQNIAVFLPVALRCIAYGADLGSRDICTSRGFYLVHTSLGEAGSINTKVAPAILRLLVSTIARPDNDLTSREQIYRAIAALSGTCGLRWMANVSVVDEVSIESDLGAAAACCTLIRLAAGELRIALGWVLGDGDDENAKGDPPTSMIYMDIVKHCLAICQAALGLMLYLSKGLDDEDAHLPTDFGPFAILHVRHSILDALDSTIQYLNEKPHESTSSTGRFCCTWDFCSNPLKGTAHGQRAIGIQCSSFLFAYVSETDIFEDEGSGMSENAPTPGKILTAMKVGLHLTNGIGLKQDELKFFGHIFEENDFVTPLLPGLAAVLSPFVADDAQGLGSRSKAIEEAFFSDSVLSDSVVATLLRLTVCVEKAMDARSGPEFEKIPSLLASLDLCAFILDGIISFHMKAVPFGLAEMTNQQTHLLQALAQSIFILLEGIESFPKVIRDHADELMRYTAIQSLDRLVRCWNHVVPIGCADMESAALKKAAGFVTLAELAVEERSEYLH